MGWLRGELWPAADLLWPAEAAAALAPIPSFGPPPGLASSRHRREEWTRRRKARKTRATVLALSPAVMLPIGMLRSASDSRAAYLAEDPPTLTFHLDTGTVWAPPGPIRLKERPDVGAAPLPKPRGRAEPVIDWHHAVSVGLPYAGRLIDGTQLPTSGPDWVTWDPVTNSVPDQTWRLYGNEHTIREILAVTRAYRAANPGAPRVVIGDISRKGGGPLTDEHVSHQNGLDVDVYYPRRDRKLVAPIADGQIDRALSQDLADRFVAAGAQMIFVSPEGWLHGPGGVVQPYPGHEYHMHVRFPPPS